MSYCYDARGDRKLSQVIGSHTYYRADSRGSLPSNIWVPPIRTEGVDLVSQPSPVEIKLQQKGTCQDIPTESTREYEPERFKRINHNDQQLALTQESTDKNTELHPLTTHKENKKEQYRD
jgi:hypothetical protein